MFVDIWASWCGPCIEEFNYLNGLDACLKANNIEMLFLSMDASEDSTKWNNLITKLHLGGNHFIANSNLKNYLIKNIFKSPKWSIPRYLLLAPDGSIILDDTKRPSSEDALYNQIKEKAPIVF